MQQEATPTTMPRQPAIALHHRPVEILVPPTNLLAAREEVAAVVVMVELVLRQSRVSTI